MHKQTLFWRFYSVIFVVIMFVGYYVELPNLRLLHIIDFFVSIPAIISLFSLAYNKKVSRPFFWQSYFYFFLIWHVLANWIIPILAGFDFNLLNSLIGTFFIVPIYIALYIYGFKFLKKK